MHDYGDLCQRGKRLLQTLHGHEPVSAYNKEEPNICWLMFNSLPEETERGKKSIGSIPNHEPQLNLTPSCYTDSELLYHQRSKLFFAFSDETNVHMVPLSNTHPYPYFPSTGFTDITLHRTSCPIGFDKTLLTSED